MPGMSVERSEQQGLYPIRTVSALTGVNPVTLRAWERRYGLVRPQRTPKGHRLYTQADIERIRDILDLLKQGIPIGQTYRLLDTATPPRHVPTRPDAMPAPGADCRERLRAAVEALDEWAVNTVYDEALSVHAIDQVTHDLLVPLLRELRAAPASLAAAGFLSAYLCNKLGARLHHESPRARGPQLKLIAAGLPGVCVDVELLLFSLAAIHRGYQVISLGGDMTPSALPGAVDRSRARGVVLFGHARRAEASHRDLTTLATSCSAPIFLCVGSSGADDQSLRTDGVVVLPDDVDEALGLIDDTLDR